ncbi:hypothetical protein [Calothrix sp. UHCC 0171]|uniref:hypothetical protein n=1 Tax=Calothrix sp. UHCC 0171 TaxID=3110245 RepID=UPI002B1EA240|nr:hypothetical protein [Calothrix sp. UHCC 0171]MEA5572214.1 hypothetical protein [Calothrix sp. UHCC 0171]
MPKPFLMGNNKLRLDAVQDSTFPVFVQRPIRVATSGYFALKATQKRDSKAATGYSTKSGSESKSKLNDSTRNCSGGVFYARRCVSQLLTVPTT